jgi:hypothetical protein
MPIELHCVHCNKLVRAPDNAAGRRAKCPYCHGEVYVPTPPDQIEELELAPEDEDWKKQKERLDAEAEQIREALRHEKEVPEGGPADRGAGRVGTPPGGEGLTARAASKREGAEALVIEFLVAMKGSQLDRAEGLVAKLKEQAEEAKEFAQRLSVDPMPPAELADVSPGVLKGLLKDLLSRL